MKNVCLNLSIRQDIEVDRSVLDQWQIGEPLIMLNW